MGDHYPLCEQYISGDGLPCICELLSLHADAMQEATRTDLREQVKALWADPKERTISSRNGYIRGYNQAIREVLQLIPGGIE